jgi:DNA polymerase elongation subunit (family B)
MNQSIKIPNILTYADIDKLPSRNDFINTGPINKSIANREPLMFLPTYVKEISLQDEKYQKSKYKILLFGILKDGRKSTVLLDNIMPYFEVRLKSIDNIQNEKLKHCICENKKYIPLQPEDLDSEISKETDKILSILKKTEFISFGKSMHIVPDSYEHIYARPFKYYQEHQSVFLRMYFNSLNVRTKAIVALNDYEYETTSDDKTSYYKVVCRDNLISFSSWCIISNYQVARIDSVKDEVFRVNVKDYKQYTGELTSELIKDKTLSMCWDIETWSEEWENGDLPLPENPKACMFCIGITFQWVNEEEPFYKICLVDYDAEPTDEYTTVVCGSEKNMIKAFGKIFAKMKPEFIFGFNDSEYDWNWLIKRATKTPGLIKELAENFDSMKFTKAMNDQLVLKEYYKSEKVKLEAGINADAHTFMATGYIPVDVRTAFRKLYPTAEKSSLKWFLEQNKLGGKEDMPYKKMFEIYGAYRKWMVENDIHGKICIFNYDKLDEDDAKTIKQFKHDLYLINKYCVVDARRCHDLMKVRYVVMDKREVAKQSYVSMYEAFYRADGMKVRNLTIAIGQQKPFCIRFSNMTNKTSEEGKYPGAFVFPPKKGLKVSKLSLDERIKKYGVEKVFGNTVPQSNVDKANDLSSNDLQSNIDTIKQLCYSIIEKYGAVISEEKFAEVKKEFESKDIKMTEQLKEFFTEPIGRPITGLDFSSLYPSIVRTYNLSPEYCILNKAKADYYAKERTITKVEFDFNGPKKGYFIWHDGQYELKDNKFGVFPYILNDLFSKRAVIKKQMKEFDHKLEKLDTVDEKTLDKEARDKLKEEYDYLIFNKNYLNSKQNALKVFMNTFYGEAGNKLSPFFVVEVAGGITTYGKRNINFAYNIVLKTGCNVYYGDTDSLYLSTPEKFFKEIDTQYYIGKMDKLTYWTKLVETTFKEINAVRDLVNKSFVEDNKTNFLSMAYEEVLYPVAFTAKKKYYGIAHENIVNFKPKSLFIRGLEVKKRGVSDILKKVFNKIMWDTCSVDNDKTTMELVLNTIDTIYSSKWDYTDFIQSAVYKPIKNNVKLKTLVERMNAIGVKVPVNERFNYVIVKAYPYKYDHRGRKVDISVGDRIELYDRAVELKMPIDLDYYMQGSINGQLARLITYHPMFNIESDNPNDEEMKKIETTIYNNACKYIENYCGRYYAKYNTFGKTYQKLFKKSSKVLIEKINTKDSVLTTLLGFNVDYENIEESFITCVEKLANKKTKHYGENIITYELTLYAKEFQKKHLITLQEIYFGSNNSIMKKRTTEYLEQMGELRSKLRSNISSIMSMYSKYNIGIQQLINIIKKELKIQEVADGERKNYSLDDFGVNLDDYGYVFDNMADEYVKKLFDDMEYISSIKKIRAIFNEMLTVNVYMAKTKSIVDYLKLLRDQMANIRRKPVDIGMIIKRDKASMDELDELDL